MIAESTKAGNYCSRYSCPVMTGDVPTADMGKVVIAAGILIEETGAQVIIHHTGSTSHADREALSPYRRDRHDVKSCPAYRGKEILAVRSASARKMMNHLRPWFLICRSTGF